MKIVVKIEVDIHKQDALIIGTRHGVYFSRCYWKHK